MPTNTPEIPPARLRIQELIRKTCDDQARLHDDVYGFFRPQAIPPAYTAGMKLVLDCADYCRFIARAAVVTDDPAGTGYAPFGNSSSIYFHLHHIDLADAQPGDIATFGYWNGEKHACILLEKDPKTGQWRVGNFGRQGEPAVKWLADEQANHRGMTMTICRLNVADPPPTAEDKLRAKTGFYAWAAWRLGEGPWKPHKPLNRTVRPNVPTVISAAWWKRYAVFLANRKKGNKSL